MKKKPQEHEEKLWRKVYKHASFLRFIPGILLVWVWNSLSMNNCHKGSDIDLFIIARKNRLWTVRVFTTLYFSLLWLRKTWNNHAGKFCLSFFITEDALSFKNIAIKNDIYLYFWILYMKPIINKDNTYNRFIKENKKWCNFSQYQDIFESNLSYIQYTGVPYKERFFHLYQDIPEGIFKSLFLSWTKKSFQKLWKPFWVIISDDMLKFHNKDRREEIRDIFYSSFEEKY